MKRVCFFAAALAFLSLAGSALVVELSSDKTGLKLNETISFHLLVLDAGSVGGGFSVYRKVDGVFEQARRTTFTSSCTLCKGNRPMGDLNESLSFIPLYDGEYRAVANYGGVSREINFTVYPITTSTIPTTTTTSSTRRTTTTSSTTTTTSSSSTTTTTTTTSSTLPVTTTTVPAYGRGNSAIIYFSGIVLVVVILVLAHLRKK